MQEQKQEAQYLNLQHYLISYRKSGRATLKYRQTHYPQILNQNNNCRQLHSISNEVIKLGWNFRDLVKEPHKAFLVQYMYYPDKEGRFGENLSYRYSNNKNNKVFVEPNKWYTIKMRIKLSEDPKQEDTILAWVNGKKVLDKKRNLRKKESYGINQVMFSLFFGGNDETWHTKKDEKVYFRRFVINGK
ncbi:hypothetical protein FJZ22_02085 [Candidatus Pacearchaeota archaeon]|nr:hypothetical protein [Candidatus Pacearchaeota archaeon]